MKYIFITYGDSKYEVAKARIIAEAENTGVFSEIYSYGKKDLSYTLLASNIINIERGGGLWSWKPDIILQTMEKCDIGDVIVYCDAGCSVYPSKEWKSIWKKLEKYDLIAQRIFQRSDKWTRKEILDMYSCNGKYWLMCYQYQATTIFKNTQFTRMFVKEWRDTMIMKPKLVMDVTEEERAQQHDTFIENRHDQAIYSALVYKYLAIPNYRDKIYTQWEHIEDYDVFIKQAIRATRIRQEQNETSKQKMLKAFKRLIKDLIFKPLYYSPLQWWYRKKNEQWLGKND